MKTISIRTFFLLSGLVFFASVTIQVLSAETGKGKTTTTIEAQEKKTPKRKKSVQSWLNRMKKKVASTQSKQNKLIAVAAVRGDEASDTPPLYWKGKSSQGPVSLPELQEFDDAISAALNGDDEGAKSKLQAFVSSHPKSPLLDDANKTLQALNEPDITP